MNRTSHQTGIPPRGFALVEFLVVLLVLVLLVAIVVPTIGGPRPLHQESRVAAEISSLSAAIARFKTVYGVDPPSRIMLSEFESGWNSADRKVIRRIWPKFNFALARDLNGDGDTNDQFLLNAPECIVFFVGGMMADGTPPIATGFSKDPADPFVMRGNREGPFMEFDPDRLKDTSVSNNPGFFEYVDSLPRQALPYLYFSSDDGAGYRMAGSHSEVPVGTFRAVYRTGSAPDAPPHKPNSFQIVSPGVDGDYGVGGPFDPKDRLHASLSSSADYDNLTNFHAGRLLR